jgi:hypothetical protein
MHGDRDSHGDKETSSILPSTSGDIHKELTESKGEIEFWEREKEIPGVKKTILDA